jgi:hypothetical protein
MKEHSTPKPSFTLRRVVAAAVAVLALMAVAGAFLMPLGDPADPVKATFVGFSKSTNGGAPLVVLRLTNESNRAFSLLSYDSLETVLGGVQYRSSTNEISLIITPTGSVISFPLLPCSGTTCQVRLPNDGGSGWPAVRCVIGPKPAFGLRGKIQSLWWRLRPPREESVVYAVCDQEIQCPRMLPDGTVEPPRLVLKEDRKSD